MCQNTEINIFDNKSDFEDIKIAAQYMGYNMERKKLSFATCDREFHRSLKELSKHYGQEVGKKILIKKNITKRENST